MAAKRKPAAQEQSDAPQRIDTEIRRVAAKALKPRGKNARFMTAEQMKLLTENIQRDGTLTSLPLAYLRDDGTLELISGHHRVEAAKAAGLDEIEAIIITTRLSETRLTGLQLSHNAITGQDDKNVLADLYGTLDLEMRRYSGLTDDSFEGFDGLGLDSLGIGAITYEELRISFLPNDRDEFLAYLKRVSAEAAKRPTIAAPREDFDEFFDTMIAVKEGLQILNAGLGLLAMARLASERLDQLNAEAGDDGAGQ